MTRQGPAANERMAKALGRFDTDTQRMADIAAIAAMETPSGRFVAQWIADRICEIKSNVFCGGADWAGRMAFLDGRKSAGTAIFAWLMRVSPQNFERSVNEYQAFCSERAAKRRAVEAANDARSKDNDD